MHSKLTIDHLYTQKRKLTFINHHELDHFSIFQIDHVRAAARLRPAQSFSEVGDVTKRVFVDVFSLRQRRRRRHLEVDVVELRMREAVVGVKVHPEEDLTIHWTGCRVVRFQGVE